MKSDLASIRSTWPNTREREETYDEDDDAGAAGDDEVDDSTHARPARRQRRKLAVFDDPKLKPALTYLQVRSLTCT